MSTRHTIKAKSFNNRHIYSEHSTVL